jgi:hypothetical protein
MAGRFILLAVEYNGAASGVGECSKHDRHPATYCGETLYTSAHEMKTGISPGGNQKCEGRMAMKTTCKSMKQDEIKQNYKNGPTPVVGKKPNGKSQLKSLS